MPSPIQILKNSRIGIIGFGNIVMPLVSGWLGAKSVRKDQLMGSCLSEGTASRMRNKFGIEMTRSNTELVRACNIVFVAVKPYLVRQVLGAVKYWDPSRHMLVSLAACMTLPTYLTFLPEEMHVVRLSLNTNSAVQACTSAIAVGDHVTEIEASMVRELMGSVGTCVPVEERHINTVSPMCGSGVAYLLLVAEALADGGLAADMKKEISMGLIAQTLIGVGRSILENEDEHLARLRDNVCSPGGVTIRGLHSLERSGVRTAFFDVVQLGVYQYSNSMLSFFSVLVLLIKTEYVHKLVRQFSTLFRIKNRVIV